ncbi:MAG: RNase P modulator RnpM [Chthonomonadales bacterium]
MRRRHIPIRSCVACRTPGDKRGLIRVVRTPQGEVFVDVTGKANGRGAYVCASEACILLARKRRSLQRSLGVEIPDTLYDALLEHVRQEPA